MQGKDWHQAAQWYRILAENERMPRKTRAGYNTRLGFALASLARDQEALTAYDTAIQLDGTTPSLHENHPPGGFEPLGDRGIGAGAVVCQDRLEDTR